MKKSTMMVAVSLAVSVAGCDQRSQVREQEKDLVETQVKANEKRAEIVKDAREEKQEVDAKAANTLADARQEKAEVDEKTAEKLADVREDVGEAKKDVIEARRDAAKDGDNTLVSGVVRSSTAKQLTVRDSDGKDYVLVVDDSTRTRHNGKDVALHGIKEGTAVRTSYVTKDGDRVARQVEVLDEAKGSHGHAGTRDGHDSMDIPAGKK